MAPEIMRVMFVDCKLAELLALDDEFTRKQLDTFARIYESVTKLSTEDEKRLPCTVLSCFFADLEAVYRFHKRTKFSNAEMTLSEFIVENREEAEKNVRNLRYFQRLLANTVFEAGRELTG
jgi:Ser/Thr protein kinase RdoA (MazF antagonist)